MLARELPFKWFPSLRSFGASNSTCWLACDTKTPATRLSSLWIVSWNFFKRAPHAASARPLPQRASARGKFFDALRPARRSVAAAMPPIASGLLCVREVWIGEALGGAARCRRIALS
jgi:hypothetical protein